MTTLMMILPRTINSNPSVGCNCRVLRCRESLPPSRSAQTLELSGASGEEQVGGHVREHGLARTSVAGLGLKGSLHCSSVISNRTSKSSLTVQLPTSSLTDVRTPSRPLSSSEILLFARYQCRASTLQLAASVWLQSRLRWRPQDDEGWERPLTELSRPVTTKWQELAFILHLQTIARLLTA